MGKAGEGGEESTEKQETTLIASPKFVSKFDPVNRMAEKANINFNPVSMEVMVRNAVEKKDNSGEPVDTLKTLKTIRAERAARQVEVEKMIAEGKDAVDISEAIRLPNAAKKPSAMTLSVDPNAPTQQMIMSPTALIKGVPLSPRLNTFSLSE